MKNPLSGDFSFEPMSGIEPETYAFAYTSVYKKYYLRTRLYIALTAIAV